MSQCVISCLSPPFIILLLHSRQMLHLGRSELKWFRVLARLLILKLMSFSAHSRTLTDLSHLENFKPCLSLHSEAVFHLVFICHVCLLWDAGLKNMLVFKTVYHFRFMFCKTAHLQVFFCTIYDIFYPYYPEHDSSSAFELDWAENSCQD